MYQDWMDKIPIMEDVNLCDNDKIHIIIGVVINER